MLGRTARGYFKSERENSIQSPEAIPNNYRHIFHLKRNHLKSLSETTFAKVNKFAPSMMEIHTRSIDFNSRSGISTFRQMRVTPLTIFGAKCKWKPLKQDKSTSRDFIARGRPLRGQKRLRLRSPRGRLVASLTSSWFLSSLISKKK